MKLDPQKTIEWLHCIINFTPYMKENKINDIEENNIRRTCLEAITLIQNAIQKGRSRSSCPFCGYDGIEWRGWKPPGAEYGYYYGFCDMCGARIRYKEEDLFNVKDALEEDVPREVQRYGSD